MEISESGVSDIDLNFQQDSTNLYYNTLRSGTVSTISIRVFLFCDSWTVPIIMLQRFKGPVPIDLE